jgi:hypothetical protein
MRGLSKSLTRSPSKMTAGYICIPNANTNNTLASTIPYVENYNERADLVHLLLVLPIFQNLYSCVSKKYKFYFVNTYTCPEYLRNVSIEIALYFEL